MNLRSALEAVPAKHRAIVAAGLGLPGQSAADEIARGLLEPAALDRIVAGLSDGARARAARRALGDNRRPNGYVFGIRRILLDDLELERSGLAFAFGPNGQTEYLVPDDLVRPLAEALARGVLRAEGAVDPRAEGAVDRPDVVRWLAAPMQLAHDAAALWAAIRREAVRIKTDGMVYQRAAPRLAAALQPTGFDLFEELLLDRRLEATLRFLRESRLVRLLTESSGGETRRELVATGDPSEILALGPDALRSRLAVGCGPDEFERAGLAVLAAHGREPIPLVRFGAAAVALNAVARGQPTRVPPQTAVQVGAHSLGFAWLIGAAEVGVDGSGRPVALRVAADRDEAPRDELAARRAPAPLAVCQSNFEVVLLRAPAPVDRLGLEVCCEAVTGQPHVYAITRASVLVGERAGVHPGGALGLLGAVAGELPQNVERTVAEWVAGIRPPLRIRTAMMLDAGDPATADRLASGPLARFVVERIGPSTLAFDAGRRGDVERALKAAGHELEPGIDAISGTWRAERPAGSSDAEAAWAPASERFASDDGPPTSSITDRPPTQRDAGPPRLPRPAEMAIAFDLDDVEIPMVDDDIGQDGDEDDLPLDVILDAIEDEVEVRIVYAGAGGVQTHTITPVEIEGAELHAWCDGPGEIERRFWVPAIRSAEYVAQ